jgi:hypothetical protein
MRPSGHVIVAQRGTGMTTTPLSNVRPHEPSLDGDAEGFILTGPALEAEARLREPWACQHGATVVARA